MESSKQWKTLEEREGYRETNYWNKNEVNYNPRKFIRKKEVLRIINANSFEFKEKMAKDPDWCKFVEQIVTEIENLETLNDEYMRRVKENE